MKTYTLPLSIITLAVALLAGVFFYTTNQAVGSVITGGEYNATQITAAGTTTARTLFGSIGSIVMTSSSAAGGVVSFYATTSQATSTNDLIFSFDATAIEGTYQYDVAFGGGLLIDANTAFDGDLVVTHR